MGKRARRGGVSNRLLRGAKAARSEQDEEARDIAARVFVAARELDRELPEGDRPLPLTVLAPAVVACENVAPGAAALMGLDPQDRQLVEDVAACLLDGFRQMVWALNAEHLEKWRRRDAVVQGADVPEADAFPDDTPG